MYRKLGAAIIILMLPAAVVAHGPSRQIITKEITVKPPLNACGISFPTFARSMDGIQQSSSATGAVGTILVRHGY